MDISHDISSWIRTRMLRNGAALAEFDTKAEDKDK